MVEMNVPRELSTTYMSYDIAGNCKDNERRVDYSVGIGRGREAIFNPLGICPVNREHGKHASPSNH